MLELSARERSRRTGMVVARARPGMTKQAHLSDPVRAAGRGTEENVSLKLVDVT
jgi:hypothetical protein